MEKKTNLSEYNPDSVPDGSKMKIGIVTAEWNPTITEALRRGAEETLKQHGVKEENIISVHVPGSYELTSGADYLLRFLNVDAVICLGCVIQGETRHFDFICEAVSQGLTNLSIKIGRPAIFGVVTTNNMEQALDRAGGKHGNKGVEGAITALKMVQLRNDLADRVTF